MSSDRTPFQKAVSYLKGPSTAAYNQKEWDDAYTSAVPTLSDFRLFKAAKWIALEVEEARKKFPSPAFGPLNAEWATILAIAALNREYRTALELNSKALKERAVDEPFVSADAMLGVRISSETGQHFTVEDLTESSTDLTENWLFDALSAQGAKQPPLELSGYAITAGRFYSFKKAMNTLWNQAKHDGWFVEEQPNGTSHWDANSRPHAILNQTWLQRQQSNLMNYPHIEVSVWPKLSVSQRRKRARTLGVTSAKRSGKIVKLRISSPSYLSSRPPHYALEKSSLEGSFLNDFLDTDMPNLPGVTVSILLLAWHLILDLAQLLSKGVKLPELLPPTRAEELALIIPTPALVQTLEQGLLVKPGLAIAIIDFLTFNLKTEPNEKGNRGLWSAPLVKVPNREEYVLPLPALETSNPVRKVEAWLEKGGIDDTNPVTTRGLHYEALYRSRVTSEIKSNKKFKNASAAPHGIKRSKDFSEEVDLLVSFGGVCLVGEVKFFLMPADPAERTRYDEKLKSAAKQAKRKADALRDKPKAVAKALQISEENAAALEFIPLVVTAQNYGFSTKVEGVLVVEAEFLKMYLSGKEVVTARAIQFGSSRTINQSRNYYANERSAAQNFVKEASSPYVLTRISSRYLWDKSPLPTIAHGRATIAVPVFGDVSGTERMRAQSYMDMLSPARAGA